MDGGGGGLMIVLPAGVDHLPISPGNGPLLLVLLGLVGLPASAAITVMTFLAVPIGSRVTRMLSAGRLSQIFALILIRAAIKLLRKTLL